MADDVPPCDWTITPVCDTEEWEAFDASVQDAATRWATQIMWAGTGRRYGLCSVTVRPCRRFCDDCPDGWFWSYGQFMPYITNGIWRNCGCGFGPGCGSCNASCQVPLPGPVDSITEVVVDGTTIDPDTYRLDAVDGMWWLVRNRHTDDELCWPECQNFDHPLGQEDTWSVTYDKGIAVPQVILDAAGILAVEWARGCTGGTCRLPGRIQNLTRQGITTTMVSVDTLLARGLTGIVEVDQVITSFNPFGLPGRLRIASVETVRQTRYPT